MAKINISITEDLFEEIEKKRREKHLTRSGFLRKAFESYLRILEEEKQEEEKKRAIERAIKLQDEIREKIGKWDSTQALRRWREARR